MDNKLTDISIERLFEQDIPELVGYNKDIVMISNLKNMPLLSHPARLNATTVFICLQGEIDCSINLKRFRISENQLLVNFSRDIIRIHNADSFTGYALMLSEDYLQELRLDFRLRAESYIGLRDNGPIPVPYEELAFLKYYYILLKKNIEDGNSEVVKSLTLALSHTILSLVKRFRTTENPVAEKNEPREQQIFDRFMNLLQTYHEKERTIQFYADKMFLSAKYFSNRIKSYSGKGALEWINEYVVLEAKMMLRYTQMSVQEVAYALNFPSQSSFGKYFRKQVGVCPKAYRYEK